MRKIGKTKEMHLYKWQALICSNESRPGGVLLYYAITCHSPTAQQHFRLEANFDEMNLDEYKPLAQIPSIDRSHLSSVRQNTVRTLSEREQMNECAARDGVSLQPNRISRAAIRTQVFL